jgi:hypothetical protein
MATHIDITKMQKLAKHYGGKCLSKEYIDEHSPLEWMCENGHRWASAFKVVNQGGWCLQCLKKRKTKEEYLEQMVKIAVEKGGKCLSKEYINQRTKLEFECAEGHRWFTNMDTIKEGCWCRKCGYKKNGINRRDSILVYQKLAEEHGGKLLSETYSGITTKMLWQCSKGHQWYSAAFNVKTNKDWCQVCIGNFPITIKDMKKLATRKSGECLSEKYINSKTKLKWKCAEGHIWMATPSHIQGGQWCRICSIKRIAEILKDNIGMFKSIAKKRGGKCLSSEYINSRYTLKFQCASGHIWQSTPYNIKKGTWCGKCKTTKKKSKQ